MLFGKVYSINLRKHKSLKTLITKTKNLKLYQICISTGSTSLTQGCYGGNWGSVLAVMVANRGQCCHPLLQLDINNVDNDAAILALTHQCDAHDMHD